MTLSKEQLDFKERFQKCFWIWERDMMEAARRWPEWRNKARELGFTDNKIDSPWVHADAGRLIKYMTIKENDGAGIL